jgi:hypothetical protein
MLFAHRARTGQTFPSFRPNETFEQTGRLPVVVRWLSRPDTAKLERLARFGVTFTRREPIASGAWLATVTEEGLHVLEADPEIARVTVDMFHAGPPPLDKSLEETRANIAKRFAIAKNGERLDGKGVVIADIDSPVYLHHPALFHADGGAFAWVDVDADGKLTPGKDGIDLDASGTIEPGEVLHELRSIAISRYSSEVVAEHTSFEPDIDYLFLDTNGNGKRDHGEGFSETTPAYGEPLFVFDDANHDKITQTSERVLQLKTSKVKSLNIAGKTYTRGRSGANGLNAWHGDKDPKVIPQLGHATAVAGVLAGGQPGLSRWIGIAPEAELIFNDTSNTLGPTGGVQWAIDQKANIVLTEYAPYTNVSLDGSSEDEAILDAAFDEGIVGVSPAGNLGSGKKHRTVTLQPGANTIPLATTLDAQLAVFSLHYRGAKRTLGVKLKTPTTSAGETIDVPESAPDGVTLPNGTYLYVLDQTTPRATHERFISLYGQAKQPKGAYELTLTLDAGAPLEVDMYASDDVSTWASGLTFTENTFTRTLCSPSTSDTTISVAAYVLHDEKSFNPGGPLGIVPGYSSRGPRLDGVPGIEIAAPDNPLSLAPPAEGVDGVIWSPFGGTSGAGPHVAAALALMIQATPKATATELRRRILDSARPVSETESEAGKGKLDIAAALDAQIASGAPPKVTLAAVGPAVVGTEATLRVSAEDDEAPSLTARWDLDYDGTFDTQWLPLGEQKISLAESELGAKLGVKVEVRDSQGNIDGATTTIEVVAPPPPPVPTAAEPKADSGCASTTSQPGSPALLASTIGLLAVVLRVRRRQRSS